MERAKSESPLQWILLFFVGAIHESPVISAYVFYAGDQWHGGWWYDDDIYIGGELSHSVRIEDSKVIVKAPVDEINTFVNNNTNIMRNKRIIMDIFQHPLDQGGTGLHLLPCPMGMAYQSVKLYQKL